MYSQNVRSLESNYLIFNSCPIRSHLANSLSLRYPSIFVCFPNLDPSFIYKYQVYTTHWIKHTSICEGSEDILVITILEHLFCDKS